MPASGSQRHSGRPRAKLALLTWAGAYALILLVLVIGGPAMAGWPLALRALVLSGLMVAALAQARATGAFTSAHEAFWALCRQRLGDAPGTRMLVEALLLLHRHLPHGDVVAGLAAAVRVAAASADVVAVEGRRHHQQRRATGQLPAALDRFLPAQPPEPERPQVASLTQRRLASLPPDTRPLPSVDAYDQLLTNPDTPRRSS